MTRRTGAVSAVTHHERLTLEVLRQFRLVYGAVHRHFRAIERRCGLSGAQAWMLRELARAPSLGVTDLATRMSVHQSTASQLIEKLVRAGYVERAAHKEDRRRVRLRRAADRHPLSHTRGLRSPRRCARRPPHR